MNDMVQIGAGGPSKDPARAAERTDRRFDAHLCPTCADLFDAFLEGAELIEPEREPEGS